MDLQYAEIGMPRTGTRSLAHAMRILGFRSGHGLTRHSNQKESVFRKLLFGDWNLPVYQEMDYYGNLPNLHWKQLAENYPHLKFILTLRDAEDWFAGCNRRWKYVRKQKCRSYSQGVTDIAEMQRLFLSIRMLGCVGVRKEIWMDNFEKHNQDVLEYFKGSDRLLAINVFQGDGWEKLCPFVDRVVPDVVFPNTRARLSS